jgi:hypothetical protein
LATPTGLLSVPKAKLAAILAASPTLQAWFGGPIDGPPFFFDGFTGDEFDALTGLEFDDLLGAAPDVAQRIYYSFLRSDDATMAAMRPFAIVDWDKFQMSQIAGGLRNELWPKEPTLRVILTDNDPIQHADPNGFVTAEEIQEGDIIFENLVGGVLNDLSCMAGVSDNLSITDIDLDIPPTRNPPKDWASDAGSYLWASFTVKYD